VQFFAPGIPQVYYTGLLAGHNDMELLAKSHVGRDINRHHYTAAEIDTDLDRPVVKALAWLMKFRNQHQAFEGEFTVANPSASQIVMGWSDGADSARLAVDFAGPRAMLAWTSADGDQSAEVSLSLGKRKDY
jgi:sucrose phosphorylase